MKNSSIDIAIIGMACRFPGSNNYDQFWDNLKEGKSSVVEIPEDRWDKERYYSTNPETPNTSVSKWGGFIEDIDKFDARFFEISPLEAEQMDPQQRIMLELAWSCFEDAGYTPSELSGSNTGVFMAIAGYDYAARIEQSAPAIEGHMSTGLHSSVAPNRISYYFNFSGPSLTVDTACSSALVAIHDATTAIEHGDCDTALVGAVSLFCNQTHFISFSKTGMLSPEGKCKTFDESANGYVRAEGAGCVYLKPLPQAIQDEDRIYALIKGSAINHGGKAQTITSPNAYAQSKLLVRTYEQANIPPQRVGYIEAHGTGTPKGDPIEINALKRAFSTLAKRDNVSLPENSCAIGTAKTNIGHMEPVAGMGGLIKTVLSIKHKMLPPILHFTKLNPRIKLAKTPFHIVDRLQEWKAMIGKNGEELPRVAGISSFGFGGVNAHVVVEEYLSQEVEEYPDQKKESKKGTIESEPNTIILSAKTENQLKEMAHNLSRFIQKSESLNLGDLSHTLWVGREKLNERLAIVVSCLQELEEKLNAFVADQKKIENLYRADVKSSQESIAHLTNDEDSAQLISTWIEKKKYEKLMEQWVKGLNLDWKQLHGDRKQKRIQLPTYPFAKVRHWFTDSLEPSTERSDLTPKSTIHPMLHRNCSSFLEQRFSSTFTGDEFFLADHIVKGEKVLPGVTYLEMVRAAVEEATETKWNDSLIVRLKNVVWLCPVIVKEPITLYIGLFPEENGTIQWEIYSEPETADTEPIIYSQGIAIQEPVTERPTLNLSKLKDECDRDTPDSKEFYRQFEAKQFHYGPNFQAVERVWIGNDQVLSKLTLNRELFQTQKEFLLCPGLTDSALQSSIALTKYDETKTALPFALEELEIYGAFQATMWAWLRFSNGSSAENRIQKVDVDLCDDQGKVCARLIGFTSREVDEQANGQDVDQGKVNARLIELTSEEVNEQANRQDVTGKAADKTAEDPSTANEAKNSLLDQTVDLFRNELSTLLKIPLNQIEADTPMEMYGIDSILSVTMTRTLEETYGDLPKTLFFEYQNIEELSQYFLDEHREKLTELLGIRAGTDHNHSPQEKVSEDSENREVQGAPEKSKNHSPLEGGRGVLLSKGNKNRELKDGDRILPEPLSVENSNPSETENSENIQVGNSEPTHPVRYASTPLKRGICPANTRRKEQRFATANQNRLLTEGRRPLLSTEGRRPLPSEAIAIIGLAGRYPQANTMREFWENIRDGKDSVTEIPKERWDHAPYFDPDKNKPGKTNGKWGGFIDGVDQFDPLFFNISPREAITLDPQERLFLQCVYETIEDAGYTPQTVDTTQKPGQAGQVGVYVGVIYSEYQLHGVRETMLGNTMALSGMMASIANRVSYYCNFHGPSLALDSMCSSTLTTVHLACHSLRRKECALAIAGGVNLSIHSNKYLLLGQGNFLSGKGRCESFGTGGDGYVPGEGLGAILLKPLSKAVEDRDHIYGVIKGTAINHGGKTNGYSVPNSKSQADVISQALKESGVHPEAISYLEAHGTGTSLGDPIEIAGLNRAFREYTKKNRFCSIGSIKSNIGHCEGAAGIAGITKVLLQLQHKQIAPSLHSKELNPNIDFNKSPFVVPQTLTDWKRPDVTINGETKKGPRIAGISSFGAGGANAHVIIEEYQPKPEVGREKSEKGPYLISLSAKNEERLREMAKNLLDFTLYSSPLTLHLSDLAYTLQVGRVPMNARLAMVVDSIEHLREKLNEFLKGNRESEAYFQGNTKQEQQTIASLKEDEDSLQMIEAWRAKGKYAKILNLWVQGLEFDWNQFYQERVPRRISLPTYPFAKESYWPSVSTQGAGASLHPLLHKNSSDLSGVRYRSTFTGQEFFLNDHRVNGMAILPGVAYLEMAREAVKQGISSIERGEVAIQLDNIAWIRPCTLENQPVTVQIELFPKENGTIRYKIHGESETDQATLTLYAQGTASINQPANKQTVQIETLKARCNRGVLSAKQYYETFKKLGLDYGPSHQGIVEAYLGENELLAKLRLPANMNNTIDQFVLHPGLMDSALQATIGLLINSDRMTLSLPFALRTVEVFEPCKPEMWVMVQQSQGQKLNIALYDSKGTLCVQLHDFVSRTVDIGEVKKAKAEKQKQNSITENRRLTSKEPITTKTADLLLLEPSWEELLPEDLPTLPKGTIPDKRHVIILCGMNRSIQQSIGQKISNADCMLLHSSEEDPGQRFEECASQAFTIIQKLLKDKVKGDTLVQIVVPAQGEQQIYAGLSGLLKTAEQESPKLTGQLIQADTVLIEQSDLLASNLSTLASENKSAINQIRFQNGKRHILKLKEIEPESKPQLPWRESGVYLITGGAGGLGLIFAQEIIQQTKNPTLILTGRSALKAETEVELERLRQQGATVLYKAVDVTNKQQVTELMGTIQKEHKSLHGIIHSAGVIRDRYIIQKEAKEFQQVLAPKVSGLLNLDLASKDLPLDFFVFFSSIAGVMGNPGQADYATANAFMDTYANYRNSLVADGKRHGKTRSINWPLWKEGGMKVDPYSLERIKRSFGMTPLETEKGLNAFYQIFSLEKGNQVAVLQGDVPKLIQTLSVRQRSDQGKKQNQTEITKSGEQFQTENQYRSNTDLQSLVEQELITISANILKADPECIDSGTEFSEYGVDSIMMMEMLNQLEEKYGQSLSPTSIVDYPTIQTLAQYLIKTGAAKDSGNPAKKEGGNTTETETESTSKKEQVQLPPRGGQGGVTLDFLPFESKKNHITPEPGNTAKKEQRPLPPRGGQGGVTLNFSSFEYKKNCITSEGSNSATKQQEQMNRLTPPNPPQGGSGLCSIHAMGTPQEARSQSRGHQGKVAIIGQACRFPKSPTLESFWDNLAKGRDLTQEVSPNRWIPEDFYSDDPNAFGKTYTNHGGFLDDITSFDAAFFGINVDDAISMDPQHRMILELTQELLDRSGYTGQELSNSRTEVILGAKENNYLRNAYHLIPPNALQHTVVNTIGNMMAARVSDFYNLKGASYTIDTACSSSLVAIHQACQSILAEKADLAIAGGVYLMVDPFAHISFSKAKVLSRDGKSYVFDERANGFVIGEGAGLILLKNYEQAVKDGDQILGTILGSAVNNDGKTMGLTVPNQEGQKQVIQTALNTSGITPDTIGYLETHGTGTLLGDPIEIKAATEVYREYSQKKGYCAVGSVKTNVGHSMTAAGVTGIIKILLSIKNRQIPATLNCEKPHPRFAFEASPFYPNTELRSWEPISGVRRAAISSFGFGGTNCHMILEEPPLQTYSTREPLPLTRFRKNHYCLGKR